MTKPITVEGVKFGDILTFDSGAWNMDIDFDASQKKLDEAISQAQATAREEEWGRLSEVLKKHLLWEDDEPKLRYGFLAFIADLQTLNNKTDV